MGMKENLHDTTDSRIQELEQEKLKDLATRLSLVNRGLKLQCTFEAKDTVVCYGKYSFG